MPKELCCTKVFDDVNHISRKSLGYHEHERSIYTFGVTINKKRKRTQKILKIVKGNRKKSYFWGLDIKGLPPPLELSGHIFSDFF